MMQSSVFERLLIKFPQLSEEGPGKALIVPKQSLLEVVDCLKNGEFLFDNLHCITAVDRPERMELVYIFYSFRNRSQAILKVYLPHEGAETESLAKFYRSADWFEREIYDLFGVVFLNHPDLSRILNPPEWEGHPLRKDYTRPGFIKMPRQ